MERQLGSFLLWIKKFLLPQQGHSKVIVDNLLWMNVILIYSPTLLSLECIYPCIRHKCKLPFKVCFFLINFYYFANKSTGSIFSYLKIVLLQVCILCSTQYLYINIICYIITKDFLFPITQNFLTNLKVYYKIFNKILIHSNKPNRNLSEMLGTLFYL